MPMPRNKANGEINGSAEKKGAKEQTFSPYVEDQEEEIERMTIQTENSMPLVIPQKPISYDYVPTGEDLQMPRIMLLQGNAAYVLEGNAKAGDWLLPGGETVDKFTVTVIGMRRSRLRATKPIPGDATSRPTVLCAAPDALHGYGNPGIICAQCPYSQWGEKDPKTGKGSPPECRLRYHYLVETHDGERAELMINTTTKTSKQAAQTLTEGVARYGNGGNFIATITRKLETAGDNKFFAPVVVSVEKIDSVQEELIAPGFTDDM